MRALRSQSTGLFKRASEYTDGANGAAFSRKTEKQKAELFAIAGGVFRGKGTAAI